MKSSDDARARQQKMSPPPTNGTFNPGAERADADSVTQPAVTNNLFTRLRAFMDNGWFAFLTPNQQAIYLIYCIRANDRDGAVAFPSVESIACTIGPEETKGNRLSRIRRERKFLVDQGLLEKVDDHTRRTPTFRVLIPGVPGQKVTGSKSDRSPGQNSTPHPVKKRPVTGSENDPRTTNDDSEGTAKHNNDARSGGCEVALILKEFGFVGANLDQVVSLNRSVEYVRRVIALWEFLRSRGPGSKGYPRTQLPWVKARLEKEDADFTPMQDSEKAKAESHQRDLSEAKRAAEREAKRKADSFVGQSAKEAEEELIREKVRQLQQALSEISDERILELRDEVVASNRAYRQKAEYSAETIRMCGGSALALAADIRDLAFKSESRVLETAA